METVASSWPLTVEPRPYQEEALARMVERGNQLLALTMGAGKTVTALATIEHLASAGAVTSGFVFCPNSIKLKLVSLLFLSNAWLDARARRQKHPRKRYGSALVR